MACPGTRSSEEMESRHVARNFPAGASAWMHRWNWLLMAGRATRMPF